MKRTDPPMRKAVFSILSLGLAALAPAAAQAADVSVSYNVDVGPMTVTTVKLTLDESGEEVHARARIRANGVSRMFSEFGATAEAETKLGQAVPEPVAYKITRDDSDKRKVTTVMWNGEVPSYDPPITNPERRDKLDRALAGGVTDPVTAVLRIGLSGDEPCGSSHKVFDGREVFELSFTQKGKGKLDGDAAWKGPVERCVVRWEPIAGRAKDKGVPGDSYEVAFAPVAKLASGRQLWLPVEMSGRLKGVGFRGYLTHAGKGGGAD